MSDRADRCAGTESRVIELLSGKRIKPTGDFVYVRKTVKDHIRDGERILLHLPEEVRQTTNWCEVIGLGPRCRHVQQEHVGSFVQMPELVTGMHRLGSWLVDDHGELVMNEDFCIREKALMEHFAAVLSES